jgi:hypothetical protein
MVKQHRRHVLAPGLVAISSNVRNVTGFLAPLRSSPERKPGKIEIGLTVEGQLARPSREAIAFGRVTGQPWADEVFYCVRLLGPLRAELRLRGLQNWPQIQVNRVYHRLIRLRLGSILPVGRHLADLVAVKLLQNHYALVHAAALAFHSQGMLLLAPPGAGKSLTSLLAVERGFSFLAEDVAIIDGERVYSLPFTTTLAYDLSEPGRKGRPIPMRARAFRWVHERAPALGILLPVPAMDIRSLAPHGRIERNAPLTFIFILSLGPKELVRMNPQEALTKSLLINRSEFTYYENKLLLGYSYFNPWLDLGDLMRREEELLAKAVGNATCFFCQAAEPAAFIEQIQSVVAS